jgi:hypothetical protein
MTEKRPFSEWAVALYKQFKEERSQLEAQFEKQSFEILQEVEAMKQWKQNIQISHEKEISERTRRVNNEILSLREQQKRWIESITWSWLRKWKIFIN